MRKRMASEHISLADACKMMRVHLVVVFVFCEHLNYAWSSDVDLKTALLSLEHNFNEHRIRFEFSLTCKRLYALF